MRRLHIALGMALGLAACASSSVTPLAQNQVLIQTTADLPCGNRGTEKVVVEMAAVETLRRGFDGFVVKTTKTEDTLYTNAKSGLKKQARAINEDPIAKSVLNLSITGVYDKSLIVTMLRKGDAGFNTATDARSVLGPDWQKTVSDGVSSCTGLF
jgi:hypothetical protein